MKARLLYASATLTLGVGGAAAAEERAQSLVLSECAAIFGEMTRVHNPQAPETVFGAARATSAALHDAAIREARAEGKPAPEVHVATWFSEYRSKWNGRLRLEARRRGNQQWIEYCDAIAARRGLGGLGTAGVDADAGAERGD